MNFPFASLSPSATAVLIGLAIVAAGFIGFVITWWIRNVLRYRLPQPFLGDGSNVEWAEQKRAEIAAGGIAYEPDLIDVSMHSDIEVTDHDSDFQSSGNSIGGTVVILRMTRLRRPAVSMQMSFYTLGYQILVIPMMTGLKSFWEITSRHWGASNSNAE